MILRVGVVGLARLTWLYRDPHNLDTSLYVSRRPGARRLRYAGGALDAEKSASRCRTSSTSIAAAARADRERAMGDARDSVDRDAAARLTASVAEAEIRAHAEGHKAGHDAGHEEGFAAGQAEARAEADQARAKADEARAAADHAPAGDPEGAERLADAIRAIGRARSLSEILDAAIESASREAERAALFLVRGGRLKAWRLAGPRRRSRDRDPARRWRHHRRCRPHEHGRDGRPQRRACIRRALERRVRRRPDVARRRRRRGAVRRRRHPPGVDDDGGGDRAPCGAEPPRR